MQPNREQEKREKYTLIRQAKGRETSPEKALGFLLIKWEGRTQRQFSGTKHFTDSVEGY